MVAICVIGFGYVGQAIAASALDFMHENKVWVVEIDPDIVGDIYNMGGLCRQGKMEHPNKIELELFEPAIKNGRLSFRPDFEFLRDEKITDFFVCVPDTSVVDVLRKLKPFLSKRDLVSIESTIGLRNLADIRWMLFDGGLPIEDSPILVISPERIMEGKLMEKFRSEIKLVGADTISQYTSAQNTFMMIGVRRTMYCTHEEAILAKMTELGYRYYNITFAHMISDLCYGHGVGFERVRALVNTCSSVENFPYSGIGIGGECLVGAMERLDKCKHGGHLILNAVGYEEHRNRVISQWVYNRIYGLTRKHALVGKDPAYARVLFLGATYRPDGTSTRDSPAAELIGYIGEQVEEAWVWDPHMRDIPEEFFDSSGEPVVEVIGEDGIENLEVDVIVLLMSHRVLYDKVEDLLKRWPHIAFINMTHYTPEEVPKTVRMVHRAW